MSKRRYTRLLTCFLAASFLFSCVQKEPSRYADGMLRSVAENEGVSSHSILDFVEEIDNQGLELHSFMLIRHNRVLAEGYWSPYGPDINHLMNSVSKTFTSTAIGFAVKEKLLTTDDPVISFFPDDLPAIISPNLEKLTVKHLLTMTVGHEKEPVLLQTDPDWVRSFLATPIVNEPGKVFQYNSYASFMLSAIIQKVSGENTFDYLTPRLFEPLDIKDISWETAPGGITMGGWGLRIKTSDMAKLGRLYLQKGKWNKKQLLPESWIKEATAVHIFQKEETTFEAVKYDEAAQGYGYQIWRSLNNAYRADGAFGQYILVMPDEDALLVITAHVNNMHHILSLFWKHLFPGIMPRMLKRNDAARYELISKIASLQIRPPFGISKEEHIRKNETYTCKAEENSLNVREFSLRFDEAGGCLLETKVGDTAYSFAFGQETWRKGETDKAGPYFLNDKRNPQGLAPFTVAGYGSWADKNELNLQLRYLTDAGYDTCSCLFDGKSIKLTLGNSAQPGETITITGYS